MARKIRPPEQVTDELDAWKLVMYATDIARIVARYTRLTEQHVLECIMRLVGHLCAIGGSQEDRGAGNGD